MRATPGAIRGLRRPRRKGRDGTPAPTWWLKYSIAGRIVRESTGTDDERKAAQVLKQREGRIAAGLPLLPRADRIRWDEAAEDLRLHYRTTANRDLDEVEKRLKHLTPFFTGRRLAAIDGAVVTSYVAVRQQEKTPRKTLTANATINKEVALLKRLLNLAFEHNKLVRVPVIRKLKEAAPRSGFFEQDHYEAVRRRLPEDLQVAVTLAHTFGWRCQSEVLPLERRHLDLNAGTLRLDPGTTKNDEGRVVYLTPELTTMLAEQVKRVKALERQLGRVIPYVFPL